MENVNCVVRTRWCVCVLWLLLSAPALAQSKSFTAADTLDLERVPQDLAWEPQQAFEVTCSPGNGVYDAVVSFDSPRPSGDPTLDRVTMWWYAARDEQGQPIDGPAVLVVHTLHPDIPFAQQIAGRLASKGIHAFLIHLPGYADRGDKTTGHPGDVALQHAMQGLADVRRGRDAIAALPHIKLLPGAGVAIQGTSLGGFVAATAASMDGAFEPVFLAFSGGDVMTVLTEGKFDAEWQHQRLLQAGYDDEQLRQMLEPIDPLRLADRLDPQKTYLYSAKADQVIPASCTAALSDAIGLDEEHHLWFDCDHYTAALVLPAVAELVAEQILGVDCSNSTRLARIGVVYVYDSTRMPIEGATVGPISASMRDKATPTDANGMVIVPMHVGPQRTQWIGVSKDGYEAQQVPVPSSWPLIVTLQSSKQQQPDQ